jgi:hypothetical protein
MLSSAIFMLRKDFSGYRRDDDGVDVLVVVVALDREFSPLSKTPADALARPSKPDVAAVIP